MNENGKKPIKSERKNTIIKYIKENGSITNKEARELSEDGYMR